MGVSKERVERLEKKVPKPFDLASLGIVLEIVRADPETGLKTVARKRLGIDAEAKPVSS